jgi:hypothetical protein
VAFLEARCWQRAAQHVPAISGAAHHDRQVPLEALATPSARARQNLSAPQRRPWHWPSLVALCALFLVAFTIGALLPNPWLDAPRSVPDVPEAARAATPSSGTRLVDNSRTLDAGSTVVAPELAAREEAVGEQHLLLGNVRFVDNSGEQIEVPVYDWSEDVAEQLMYPAQPLPAELYEQLKRHQVRSHQRFVPVRLQDGRQVVVPVQQVEIVPVGGMAY